MQLNSRRWLRNLVLSGIYALGIFGILASGDGDNDVITQDFTCGLSVRGIATTAGGEVWIGVFAKTDTGTEDRVVLLGTDGSEQLSYFIGDGGSKNAIRTVALATDGSNAVYVGGDFGGGILRLQDNGKLDGVFAVGTGFNGRVNSIAPAADGSGDIYVGGSFSTYKGNIVSGLVRLDNTGMNVGINPTVAIVESVAMEAPGVSTNVYSGGPNIPGDSSGIGRWDNLGVADPAFSRPAGVSPVQTVAPALDGSGDVYVGGNFATRIIRLNNDGTPDDLGFNDNVGAGFDSDVLSIDRAASGGIYVGGDFAAYDGNNSNGIARIDGTGVYDGSFNVGTGFTDSDGVFPFSKVASVVQDASNDIFVGGGFTEYDGTAANGIVRLETTGDLDRGFDVGVKIDGDVCNRKTIPDS